MAGKEAILILLDMGKSMQDNFGVLADQKRMEVAVNCIKLMLQQKMFNSKTHEVGLILFGLKETGDQKIMYIRGLGKPDIDFLKNVQELKNFESEDVAGGDIFEALDQTLETIQDYVGTKKYEKKVFLMTAGQGKTSFNLRQVQELGERSRKMEVKINVIGFDFLKKYKPENQNEDQELQKLEENDPQQTQNQNVNQRFLGVLKEHVREKMQLFPSGVAIQLYEQFRSRQVNLRSKFSGDLQIAPGITIPIQMFTKTTEEKLPGLKPYSLAVDFNNSTESGKLVREIGQCISEDPNMSLIDKANVTKAFHYGKKLIPISHVLQQQMEYQSQRELKVLGFVNQSSIPRQSYLSGADILIANQSNPKSKKGLAALCQASKQLNKVALVRYVWRHNSSPKLCVLVPQIGKSHECFYMVQVPTSESMRDFQFNPLIESTQPQQQAIGNLIDKMDLMKAGEDKNEEALNMKYTFNPTRQYLYQTVFYRVFNPDGPIPELDENIKEYMLPEKQLIKNAEAELDQVKQAFKLEVVDEGQDKQLNKKVFWRQLITNNNNNNNEIRIKQENNIVIKMEVESENQAEIVAEAEEAALIQKKFAFDDNTKDDVVRKVSSVSPVDDFFKMISNKKEDLVQDAMKDMRDQIQSLVETSIRGSFFDKAITCLKALRRGCTSEFEQLEAPNFNQFLFSLKNKYLKTKENCTFWKLVIQQGVTLITKAESKKSNVSTQESIKFLEEEEEEVQDIPLPRKVVQDYDIMDELE